MTQINRNSDVLIPFIQQMFIASWLDADGGQHTYSAFPGLRFYTEIKAEQKV